MHVQMKVLTARAWDQGGITKDVLTDREGGI